MHGWSGRRPEREWDVCRVCGGPFPEAGWKREGYASHFTCRRCLYQPGFDGAARGVSYAEWGDRWVASFPEHTAERRAWRDAAWELFPRTWAVGDLIRIPTFLDMWVLGQITWIHPHHYRIQLTIDSTIRFDHPDGISLDHPPRRGLVMRTADWALLHGLWPVIGSAPLDEPTTPPQLLVSDPTDPHSFFAVDPVTFTPLDHLDLTPHRETLAEWGDPVDPAHALVKDRDTPRAYYRYLFTRTLADARLGAPDGRTTTDPIPGLLAAGSPLPLAQWQPRTPEPGLRVLPVRLPGRAARTAEQNHEGMSSCATRSPSNSVPSTSPRT